MAVRPGSWSGTGKQAPAARTAAPPKPATVPPPKPAAPSVPPPAPPRPLTGDAAAIAEAVAAGRVTKVPDAMAFAKLPAIVDTKQAVAALEAAGAKVGRAGVGWSVDGRKLDNVGLIQAAQQAQRQTMIQGQAQP